MPGRSSGTLSTGYARIEKVRRSKSPVARVARQLAYSPLVAISLTSTVTRRSASAGMHTSKRSPSFSVLTRSSRRSKVDPHVIEIDQGYQRHAGRDVFAGLHVAWYTCETTGAYTTICAMIELH